MRGLVAVLLVALLLAPGARAATTQRSASYPFDGHLAEKESRTFRFTVSEANVTSLEFALAWTETDDKLGVSGPDRFQLVVVDPSGREAPGSPTAGANGALDVKVAVPEAARASAKGAWQITVTLLDCNNKDGVKSDTGNDFHFAVTMGYLEETKMHPVQLRASSVPPAGSFAEPSYWGYATIALGVAAVGLGAIAVVKTRGRGKK